MAKTNGCLVAHVCLRYWLGRDPCASICDEELLDWIKDVVFQSHCATIAVCIPAFMAKKAFAHVRETVYASQDSPVSG